MRWDKIVNAYTEIESHQLAAEVLWGTEITKKMKLLNEKVTKLRIALEQHLYPEMRTKKPETIDNIIYNQGNDIEDDDFGKEINQSIGEIKNFIKDKLKNK